MAFTAAPAAGAKLRASVLNALITEVRPVSARKTSTQTVNNSTTLVNDTELFVAAEASVTYLAEIKIYYNSGTTPDIKFALTVPAGTTGTWGGVGYDTASALLTFGPLSIAVALPFGGLAADKEARLNAVIVTSTTAGTIQVQWAQNTLNASNTNVLAGSYITLKRIS